MPNNGDFGSLGLTSGRASRNRLCVSAPQWQDSGLSSELYRGALALREYAAKNLGVETVNLDVDKENIPVLKDRILGFDILKDQLSTLRSLLAERSPDTLFTLGGGCGLEVPILDYFAEREQNLRLFWFDAHGDLNSPETSLSAHFHGMPLRFITERQDSEVFTSTHLVPCNNVSLIGARDLDPPEEEYIHQQNICHIPVGPRLLTDLQSRLVLGGAAYIHVDLDAIDPEEYRNVKCPAARGLRILELTTAISFIRSRMRVVGVSILENTETRPEELEKIRPLLAEALG